MRKSKIVIPHEHGGWAMVTVPFLLGMFAGKPTWMHIPLFLAWLFFYLGSYPFLQSMKKKGAEKLILLKWAIGYGAVAIFFLLPPLIALPELLWFGPLLAVLFAVNIGHTIYKRERALLNDICAILSFAIGGAAAYLLGSHEWNITLLLIILYNFLYFIGSAFFVKTIFRERKNPRWLMTAKTVQILIISIPMLLGHFWMSIPYLFAAARTFLYGGKGIRPMKVGMIEIIGAVQFMLLSILFLPEG